MKIAVDWSYTKGLTTYDGEKVRVEDRKSLLQRLKKLSKPGDESINNEALSIILEEGCPASLIYDLLLTGSQVQLISNRASEDYRVKHGIAKSDENDARIIWELANSGVRLRTVNVDDTWVQLHSLYRQYVRYQKARVAMQNMKKGYLRYFGGEESGSTSQLSGDTVPYDIAIDSVGIGKGTFDIINRQIPGVRSINAGEKPSGPEEELEFINLRAEIFWKTRKWILEGGKLEENEDWYQLSKIKYKVKLEGTKGKMQIISKEELLREGIESPDIADALAMTFIGTEIPHLDPEEEELIRFREEGKEKINPFNPFELPL